jgi:hypothetical protein
MDLVTALALVVCSAVALIVALALGITAITAAICVGVTVAIMLLDAKVPALAAIPAAVYGYASTAALFLLGAAAYSAGASAVVKVAAVVAISMVIGNVLGYVSEKVAGALVKS